MYCFLKHLKFSKDIQSKAVNMRGRKKHRPKLLKTDVAMGNYKHVFVLIQAPGNQSYW